MNKIRNLKVSKIQPELSQKELILFNYGLDGKKGKALMKKPEMKAIKRNKKLKQKKKQ